MERWIEIADFPNYEVSSLGRVRNRDSGVILKTYLNKQNGYETVRLWDGGRHVTKTIHRLVADTFYDGDHSGHEVNHIDGDKTNNFVGNLEWCTSSENTRHAIRNGLFTPYRLPPNPHPRVKVRIVETGEEFDSLTDCADYIGGFKTAISACLRGVVKTHKGYHYELVE